MTERTLRSREDQQYLNRLTKVAEILTALSDDNYYTVEDVYLDMDTNWMWTTIIAHNPNESGILSRWQAISPRVWKQIVVASTDIALLDIVKEIISK